MATAHRPAPLSSIRLPSGESDDHRCTINTTATTSFHIAETLDDGQTVITELGGAPAGTKEIYTQHRMCGDFYCFIHGRRQVAAIGDTLKDAFENAVRLAA